MPDPTELLAGARQAVADWDAWQELDDTSFATAFDHADSLADQIGRLVDYIEHTDRGVQ